MSGETEQNEFSFETENMALKGNKDYLKMLSTLAVLESQRLKAIKDIDILLDLKDKALENPEGFVNKLKNKEDLGIPTHQQIADICETDWGKYKVTLPAEAFRPHTRNVNVKTNEDALNLQSDVVKVRGRVYDPSKPVTFNKLWSVEEQKRLEELLVQFPPEDNEFRRYTKIATALGNRTAWQVSSRCQKYFKKLHQAGLPVPGRIPKSTKDITKGAKCHSLKHRSVHSNFPRSTFFPIYYTPVEKIEDYDSNETNETKTVEVMIKTEPDEAMSSLEMDVPDDMKDSEDYKKLMLLKRVQKDRMSLEPSGEHFGFKCDECEDDPIIGTRWHCDDCDSVTSVDFCTDCLIQQLDKPNPHSLSHKLVAVRSSRVNNQVFDQDYNFPHFSKNGGTSYNYLDPNFIPNL